MRGSQIDIQFTQRYTIYLTCKAICRHSVDFKVRRNDFIKDFSPCNNLSYVPHLGESHIQSGQDLTRYCNIWYLKRNTWNIYEKYDCQVLLDNHQKTKFYIPHLGSLPGGFFNLNLNFEGKCILLQFQFQTQTGISYTFLHILHKSWISTKAKQYFYSIWIMKENFSETGPFLPHFPDGPLSLRIIPAI